MGERNERVSSTGFLDLDSDRGAGIKYVKFVVDASNWAPRYSGKETLYLGRID